MANQFPKRNIVLQAKAGHLLDWRKGAAILFLYGGFALAYSSTALSEERVQDENRVSSSVFAVERSLNRIEAYNEAGPDLSAVISVNPSAVAEAQRLDQERADGNERGALHGIPILIKDNIDVGGEMPTTAGSKALADNFTTDAFVVQNLRAAGAVVLGKTNLSEWGGMRGSRVTGGWSGIGGVTRNPYALDRSACGSSSGSAAAVAAGFAPAAIGTETDGSITCPASVTGLVGLKPTHGLVSRSGIVPISRSQDVAGPITRTVRDAAMVLNAIAGADPADPATAEADTRKIDYVAALQPNALAGLRIGVARYASGFHTLVDPVFEEALETLSRGGAVLVELPADLAPPTELGEYENIVLINEMKTDLEAYLNKRAPDAPVRSIADLVEFNAAAIASGVEPDQSMLVAIRDAPGIGSPQHMKALRESRRIARDESLDLWMQEYRLDLIVAPTTGPAWRVDLVNGDNYSGGMVSQLPAVAGYPHLTVPMGDVMGLPIGLSLIGPAWSDGLVLAAGHEFERLIGIELEPGFVSSIDP